MDADYHVHSSYSDGRHLPEMVQAAVDADLEGIGFADHVNVSDRPETRVAASKYAFTLDLTYERRRNAIEAIRKERGIEVYDAVEVDYHQADEDAIASFLEEAGFDYAIGSVHEIDGFNVHETAPFDGRNEEAKRAVVEEYFDRLESLIRSELFDVAAHPDIIERNKSLRGLPGQAEYERIAVAFEESRTIPEINAGRIDWDYGRFHPNVEFLETLLDHGIQITVGSDSHRPQAIRDRVPTMRRMLEDRGIEPVSPFDGS